MKFVNVLFLFVLSALFLTSCQKELDFGFFESAGTLKTDAGFECLPSSVHGTYLQNTVLTDTNYIEVQVNTTLSGSYTIQSDTVNGYYFKGTGEFTNVGLNTVRLYGDGTPLLPGTNSFIVRYDSSFCIIDVDVLGSLGNAQYTFSGAGGTCTGAILNGTYIEGTATTAGNTVVLEVNVTTAGNYSISTTTENGVTFSASGVFANTTSPQTVTLTASGTPIAAGTVNFPVSGASGSCAFSVTFLAAAPPATYSLGGTPGSCTGAVVTGSYVTGVATTSSNTMTINVTVTVAGSYSISTTSQNGITFSGSGLFTTGTTQVTLTASGTPAASGPFNFDVNGSSSSCSFSVTFTDPPTDFITCSIDGGATTTFNLNTSAILDNTSTPTTLDIAGFAAATGSEQIYFTIQGLTGIAITNTTYDVNMPASTYFIGADYTDVAAADWIAASDGTVQSPAFSITITSITTGPSGRITGTFSGPVKDNNGAGPGVKIISNGTFDLALQ